MGRVGQAKHAHGVDDENVSTYWDLSSVVLACLPIANLFGNFTDCTGRV
jgi:hypothetical protein